MMRQIVGLITGVLMSLYMIYFVVPMLYNEHNTYMVSPYIINSTDPTVVTSFVLGQGFYTVMPLVPVLVGVFVIFNYSLKGEGGA